ncbi:Rieske 2Fe-2S domain-containing protein [Nannocystis sp. ILAH1]|uniref:Rieske 2Fe-2S domain-containing protein n=1 Tax=unclassified Nannocystis TaxID=2627009 RepID=UPI002270AECA|nr:Rieske 2Fe-2S domain-containing protein [Nannocystis sp. ILAH1]MCY1071698.1 Rieske 2Fe-2S domain-containing protein [Nannocystis sp. RBIL2]
MGARFPFPSFPRGWFVIGFPEDIAPGQVKTLRYFAQDIVVFRTESGVLSAVDKVCPHLGAHLGGGHVKGECLRCPFHDWGFRTDGVCVDVPYAPKIPPKAAVKTWHIREQNGVILAWYCPKGEAPAYEVPVLEEEGWTGNKTVRWVVRSHPQEVAENTVDCSHLGPVHHVGRTDVLSVEQEGHFMRVVLHMEASGAPIDMPDEFNDVQLDVKLYGIGHIVSSTTVLTSDMRTRQRIYPTPIDEDTIAIFGVSNIKQMADEGYTHEIEDIFYKAFLVDFPKDFPIWENKAYLDKPMLAGGDGPIGRYRRWCRQFYDYPEATAAQPTAAPASAAAQPTTALGKLKGWLRTLAQAPAANSNGGSNDHDSNNNDGGLDAHLIDLGPRKPRAAAVTGKFASVGDYFETLERRFNPAAAGDLTAVIQWVLTGDKACAYFAEIKGGSVQRVAGTHPAPTITIEMSAEDYLLMINGELNGARAFSTGRGRLRGPVRLAMKMQRLFPLEAAV